MLRDDRRPKQPLRPVQGTGSSLLCKGKARYDRISLFDSWLLVVRKREAVGRYSLSLSESPCPLIVKAIRTAQVLDLRVGSTDLLHHPDLVADAL